VSHRLAPVHGYTVGDVVPEGRGQAHPLAEGWFRVFAVSVIHDDMVPGQRSAIAGTPGRPLASFTMKEVTTFIAHPGGGRHDI
ncbi:MAG: hypothetical protein ACOC9H_00925, partial [Gemmatimonadota bacterium]